VRPHGVNTEEQKGKFYNVRGESMPKTVVRRGILTGNSPFHFEGKWAERIGDKYLLYDGWITNCKIPGPWWKLRGPKFDIIPEDRALAYRSRFLLRKVPIFYTPYFYHSLAKRRAQRIYAANLVAHSQRGPMVVWATTGPSAAASTSLTVSSITTPPPSRTT